MRTHREGTSKQRSDATWCLRPCTPRPSRHHRASPGCDSATWIGQSWRGILSRGRMLGCATAQVNVRLHPPFLSHRFLWTYVCLSANLYAHEADRFVSEGRAVGEAPGAIR